MLGDVLTGVGLLLTAVSIAFAGFQIRRSTRDNQARFLLDVNNWLFADEDVRKFYYRLDYGSWQFDPATFRQSDDERMLDKLLYTLDTVQRLIESKHIRRQDLSFLWVEAAQVLNNPEVQKYFAWLRNEFPDRDELSISAAERLAKTLPGYR